MTDVKSTCRNLLELKDNAQLACRVLFYECLLRGINVFVTETYRSPLRQKYLYEQGRTRPGQVVTWTLSSNHSNRQAWDIAVCPPNNLYDSNILSAVGKIARDLGITWGGDWKNNIDRPHFEVTTVWKLPKKYDEKVIRGVVVPSNSSSRVQLTVNDNDALYKDKIGYNVVKDAVKFRLVSSPFPLKKTAENKRVDLINEKHLSYAEIKTFDNEHRIQSGAYTSIQAAENVARKLIRDKELDYISVVGTTN